MSGLSRAVGGIAVGVVLLVGISWFDADQFWYAQRQADAGINSAGYSLLPDAAPL
jgi:O-antigen ligase